MYQRLMYETETENVHKEFYEEIELFDFSKHSKGSKYDNKTNNLVFRQVKDKTCWHAYKPFHGTKRKYVYLCKERPAWM